MPDEPSSREEVLLLAVVVEGGLIALAWGLGWLLGQSPLASFRWDVPGVLWGVLATLPMLAAFFLMNRWPVGPLKSVKGFSETVLRPMLAPLGLVDLGGVAVLAGLGEEMLFRAVLQGWLGRILENPTLAILLVAVLFGVVHAVNTTYAVLAAITGVYLGWLYQSTGNLLAPVLAHALYDFVVLLYLMRGPGSEVELPDEDEGEGDEESDEAEF